MRPSLSLALRLSTAATAGVLALVIAARPGIAADDAAAGQALFKTKCTACHSVDADRIGPRLQNVVGRPVASVPTYSYSPALKKLGGGWTPARLDQWLSGTQKMAPGSKMFLQVDDPAQRRLIVAYLQSVSEPSGLAAKK
ncbi:c-type cytochrome [Sphingomonas oligoaromativorans]|uniref:c-type cytochrome n=1 Tax=Sphingomonas oligoaromativorans TaxID=575322 RepID=UPI0014223CE6|nr:c-type cytochrome [Sphingomonas oligoaromativorans]